MCANARRCLGVSGLNVDMNVCMKVVCKCVCVWVEWAQREGVSYG